MVRPTSVVGRIEEKTYSDKFKCPNKNRVIRQVKLFTIENQLFAPCEGWLLHKLEKEHSKAFVVLLFP